jgi:hypothetical protein
MKLADQVAAKLKMSLRNLRKLVAGRLLGQRLEIAQLIVVDVPEIFLRWINRQRHGR